MDGIGNNHIGNNHNTSDAILSPKDREKIFNNPTKDTTVGQKLSGLACCMLLTIPAFLGLAMLSQSRSSVGRFRSTAGDFNGGVIQCASQFNPTEYIVEHFGVPDVALPKIASSLPEGLEPQIKILNYLNCLEQLGAFDDPLRSRVTLHVDDPDSPEMAELLKTLAALLSSNSNMVDLVDPSLTGSPSIQSAFEVVDAVAAARKSSGSAVVPLDMVGGAGRFQALMSDADEEIITIQHVSSNSNSIREAIKFTVYFDDEPYDYYLLNDGSFLAELSFAQISMPSYIHKASKYLKSGTKSLKQVLKFLNKKEPTVGFEMTKKAPLNPDLTGYKLEGPHFVIDPDLGTVYTYKPAMDVKKTKKQLKSVVKNTDMKQNLVLNHEFYGQVGMLDWCPAPKHQLRKGRIYLKSRVSTL